MSRSCSAGRAPHRRPVSAPELEEHRGVGRAHLRLDDQRAETSGHRIHPHDDLFVRQAGQQIFQMLAVLRHAASAGVVDKAEFSVCVDGCVYAAGASDGIRDDADDIDVCAAGENGVYAGARLRGISSVCHHDPVLMPQEWSVCFTDSRQECRRVACQRLAVIWLTFARGCPRRPALRRNIRLPCRIFLRPSENTPRLRPRERTCE